MSCLTTLAELERTAQKLEATEREVSDIITGLEKHGSNAFRAEAANRRIETAVERIKALDARTVELVGDAANVMAFTAKGVVL